MSDPVNEPQSGSGTEPQAQTESPAVTGSSEGGGGRTPENMYAEFARKNKQLNEQIAQLTNVVKELAGKVAPPQETPKVPFSGTYTPTIAPRGMFSAYGAPNVLSEFNDAQLTDALRSGTLPGGQQELIRAELHNRGEERRFNQRFEAREREQRVNDLKTRAEKAAFDSFPALRDSSSEFSRRVEAELQERRRLQGESPTDKYDVANAIARQMNVEVSRAVVPGYVAGASEGSERAQEMRREETQPLLADDQIDELSRKFAHTLPYDYDKTGRPVRRKFDTKRIKESSKQYADASDLMRTKGTRVTGR